ncbi:MAG: asparagine synthase (glutamine-hydrolyzing) [Candidatus Lambdaproteobacteria bacterium RIFOXYD1_FULL_56_27]|uniref:asparagine synthase (glutamine-hydrolyzing) n=1 Tax=Candidatus Lambdaproteobacteria bacterium RIFOXYD2_FULL_56_26 TaxID=1817773 RepID=A0A1F6GNJ2_9PROT|nr:MAG: asparagine synthase (glutamine-hydrolyzing) [Candidatus Lambdaproteobacteria bacterium RIFOXYD2_FULL_56_26]OGG99873.1 MAG: asparagine synthase (glutamine-hydrolyzing) [Candidatus Lambdaproteobacteria bacterium RIFOXYC1_FULL_56_13]OGH09688.1 MAG: asparagine synthase (glutamine-hydrolyzing) [Candidatus Lambdaproteobacteria bacterium RIFOXYD1_FULL_56_27]
MKSACGRYAISFNGEIYNHKELREFTQSKGYQFKTHSDTEAILSLYSIGIEAPELMLRGMFAFALFDFQEQKLLLVRDRMGEKPLFYFLGSEGVYFASEIKSLLELSGRHASGQAIWDFLSLGYLPGTECAFEHIEQVPPATKLTVKKGIKENRYWKLESKGLQHLSEDQWADRLFESFAQAVHLRLESDVPIGLYLSSGLDSNAVMECIRQTRPGTEINTYTAGFEEVDFDESKQSAAFAKDLGFQNHQVVITPQMIQESFSDIVAKADNLHANPAMFPQYFLAKRASIDLKVILTGGGGDELMLGYPTYLADRYKWGLNLIPEFMQGLARTGLNLLPASHKKLSLQYKLKKFLDGAKYSPEYAHYFWRTIFTEEDKAQLLPEMANRDTVWCYQAQSGHMEGYSALEGFAYQDLMVWWANMGLYQADTMGMSHSVEVRTPMMDHEFMRLCFEIPEHLKLKGFQGKAIFRKAMSRNSTLDLMKMKKKGFHVPLASWFANQLQPWVYQKLSPDRIRALGFIQYSQVEKLIKGHVSRRADFSWHLINLLVLVEWYHQYILQEPS